MHPFTPRSARGRYPAVIPLYKATMMPVRPLAVAFASLALAAAAPADDPTLARIVADAARVSETSFAFERTLRAEAPGEAGVRVERFRPDATPRWTLVSIDGKSPAPKAAGAYAKDAAKQPVPSYHRVGLVLRDGAERIQDADGKVRYRVARVPDGVWTGNNAGMAKHLAAEATIAFAGERPYVAQMRFYAPRPFRMRMVAKVDRFEATTRYAPAGSDARPRIVAQDTVMAGSMLGRAGTITTRATFKPI